MHRLWDAHMDIVVIVVSLFVISWVSAFFIFKYMLQKAKLKSNALELKMQQQYELSCQLQVIAKNLSSELLEINKRMSSVKLNVHNIYTALHPSICDKSEVIEFFKNLIQQGYALNEIVDKFRISDRELTELKLLSDNIQLT